jgi:actin-related protein 2
MICLCLMQDIVVGAACADLRHQLDVSYPVTNGIVQNWDDMGHIWDHAFYSELKVDPSECKILLTDPPLNPLKNREQMIETMFERYNFSGVFIQIQAVLSLYAQGSYLLYTIKDTQMHRKMALVLFNACMSTFQAC